MPSGLPDSSALNSKSTCVFSLDTSVIEAAGFRFNDGPLRNLAAQLPPWFQLWMPDIIVREISQHRSDNVTRAIQQIHNGMLDLRRHTCGAIVQSEPEWIRSASDDACNIFDNQLHEFIKSHNGTIIAPSHAHLSERVFELYFNGRPPFGGGKDKKHEFPDAASLVMLDYLAVEKQVQVITVSKDVGWKAYAEDSERIYCVSSLQDLTAMFLSATAEAKGIQRRFCSAFEVPTNSFRSTIKEALEKGLISLPWRIKLPRSARYGFDVGVIESRLISFEAHPEAMGVWVTSPKQDACVVEIPVDVDVSLRVEVAAHKYDDYDDQIDSVVEQILIEHQFEAKLQLELTGALLSAALEDLIKNIGLGDSPIEVDVGHDKLGANRLGAANEKRMWGSFDDLDDEIPF